MSKNKDEYSRTSAQRSEGGQTPSEDQREEAKKETGQPTSGQKDLFQRGVQGRFQF